MTLLETLEQEISKTPSGDLRNLLCDLNIALRYFEKSSIKLNNVEIKSGVTRQRIAEGLIQLLPKDHEGRKSWLLNYGESEEAVELRRKNRVNFLNEVKSSETTGSLREEGLYIKCEFTYLNMIREAVVFVKDSEAKKIDSMDRHLICAKSVLKRLQPEYEEIHPISVISVYETNK